MAGYPLCARGMPSGDMGDTEDNGMSEGEFEAGIQSGWKWVGVGDAENSGEDWS